MSHIRPRWQDRMLAEVEQMPEAEARRTTGLNFPNDLYALLMEAARKRHMSIGAYGRRAIMAFVVRDLGLDWGTVMENEPRIRTFGQKGDDPQRLGGTGYGDWVITDLEPFTRD